MLRPVKIRGGRQDLLLLGACLLSIVVALKHGLDLEGTEFSGGWVTGPLLRMHTAGMYILVLALFLTLVTSRVAAASALIGSLLCLPLYTYFTIPGVFRLVFPGEYSVPSGAFRWSGWTITGLALIVVVAHFFLRNFFRPSSSRP